MRLLILAMFLLSGGISLHAQQVSAESNSHTSSPPQSWEINEDLLDMPGNEQDYEKYTCQRCGSENLIYRGASGVSEVSPLVIPHCIYCGKKYWPKFTPSSIIQRTYCALPLLDRNHMMTNALPVNYTRN